MSETDSTSEGAVTLRLDTRAVLVWATIAASALWADIVLGLGLYGIYAQWAAHRLSHLTGNITLTLGLSAPLFLLLFTVAAAWLTLAFVGARSQQLGQGWSSLGVLAVVVNLVAAILLVLAAGSNAPFTGDSFSSTLWLSVLLALDGVVAAVGTVRFYQHNRA